MRTVIMLEGNLTPALAKRLENVLEALVDKGVDYYTLVKNNRAVISRHGEVGAPEYRTAQAVCVVHALATADALDEARVLNEG